MAAGSKQGTKVLDWLVNKEDCINDISNPTVASTPLHFACLFNNTAAIKLLCRRNANINLTDSLGNIPLVYAIENANIEAVRCLDQNGSNALKKNKDNLCALHSVLTSDSNDIYNYYASHPQYALKLKELYKVE